MAKDDQSEAACIHALDDISYANFKAPRKISLDTFREAGVCSDGFMHFAAAFGHEVEVTPETCAAMVGKLNFAFGADVFLKGRQREVYLARAREADKITTPKREAIDHKYEAEMAAWRLKPSLEVLAAISQDRDAAYAALIRERETQQAQWFCEAYNAEE